MNEDIEITLARRLGEVVSDMRNSLDDDGTKRVLVFILDRYGIFASGISVFPLKVYAAPPTLPKLDIHLPKDGGEYPLELTCPICWKNGFKKRSGTAGHMIRVHHIAPKTYFSSLKSQVSESSVSSGA
jgi:hypothetical protein